MASVKHRQVPLQENITLMTTGGKSATVNGLVILLAISLMCISSGPERGFGDRGRPQDSKVIYIASIRLSIYQEADKLTKKKDPKNGSRWPEPPLSYYRHSLPLYKEWCTENL